MVCVVYCSHIWKCCLAAGAEAGCEMVTMSLVSKYKLYNVCRNCKDMSGIGMGKSGMCWTVARKLSNKS